MPKNITQLTIFISGPNDVAAEKAALRTVVNEMNWRIEKAHSVTLRVVTWPDDFIPAVGSEPQAVINDQIDSSYDIYIGIIGNRFGTPTKSYPSGTEEEFNKALMRFEADSTSVRLLFYFKHSSDDPYSIDLEQFQRVKDFRSSLSGCGVVYCDVKDTVDFVEHIKKHLDSIILDDWIDGSWRVVNKKNKDKSGFCESKVAVYSEISDELSLMQNDNNLNDDEPFGFIEHTQQFELASDLMVKITHDIAVELESIGNEINFRTQELNDIQLTRVGLRGDMDRQIILSKIQGVIDNSACNLHDFVERMRIKLEEYRYQNKNMFYHAGQSYGEMSAELIDIDSQEDQNALKSLVAVMHECRNSIVLLQKNIMSVPALTSKFKRERKRAAAVLGELIAEVSFSIDESKKLIARLG